VFSLPQPFGAASSVLTRSSNNTALAVSFFFSSREAILPAKHFFQGSQVLAKNDSTIPTRCKSLLRTCSLRLHFAFLISCAVHMHFAINMLLLQAEISYGSRGSL
jgi:hypothetical protein